MVKAKVYRVLGWFFLIVGIISYLANVCQPYKLQEFLANPSAQLVPSLFGLLTVLAFNLFIWAGLLALRQADKDQNKTRWPKIVKSYGIFTVAMVVILLLAILIPNLLRH